ncbi:hypothetical protein LIER_12986 [Lithospermum erythrorhizon]|uniref:Uncharacterized protein n=1 Tax=Lithospermum erythrorhizon TaxID=34254 RepID=A0AAV3PTV7_LITER
MATTQEGTAAAASGGHTMENLVTKGIWQPHKDQSGPNGVRYSVKGSKDAASKIAVGYDVSRLVRLKGAKEEGPSSSASSNIACINRMDLSRVRDEHLKSISRPTSEFCTNSSRPSVVQIASENEGHLSLSTQHPSLLQKGLHVIPTSTGNIPLLKSGVLTHEVFEATLQGTFLTGLVLL